MINGLVAYRSYKASSEPWLGPVPARWELRRTKTILRERREKGHPNEPLLAATQSKGVVRKEDYENRTVLALKDLQLLKLVREGDFVISLRSFQGGIEYARHQGIISPAYTVLYPIDPQTHVYLAWVFKSLPYVENLSLHVTGIRQGQNIDYGRLARSRLPMPPPDEQAAIVRFLDAADRRIRHYIAAQSKLVALLNEQRQIIIRRAITRGLDPRVTLRPSGIDWLGDVPRHWAVPHLRYLTECLDGKRVPLNAVQRGSMQGDVPYWGANRVIDRVSDWLFDEPLVLLGEDGAPFFEPGRDVAFFVAGRVWVNNHAHVLRCRSRLQARFLAHALNCVDYMGFIDGSTRDKLTQQSMGSIPIPLPPVGEQAAIVGYIDEETSDLSLAATRASRQIELLRECRTRLMADVITGKVDVREAAAQLPDEVELPEPPSHDALGEGDESEDEADLDPAPEEADA